MQTENKGNMKRHWGNKAELTRGSSVEHGGAGKQESGALTGRGPSSQRKKNERTDSEILFFIFQDGISYTNDNT